MNCLFGGEGPVHQLPPSTVPRVKDLGPEYGKQNVHAMDETSPLLVGSLRTTSHTVRRWATQPAPILSPPQCRCAGASPSTPTSHFTCTHPLLFPPSPLPSTAQHCTVQSGTYWFPCTVHCPRSRPTLSQGSRPTCACSTRLSCRLACLFSLGCLSSVLPLYTGPHPQSILHLVHVRRPPACSTPFLNPHLSILRFPSALPRHDLACFLLIRRRHFIQPYTLFYCAGCLRGEGF